MSEFDKEKKNRNCNKTHSSDAVYGLGLIGAAVYYISIATSFWGGVLGFLKALVWPAFLVYEVLGVSVKRQPTHKWHIWFLPTHEPTLKKPKEPFFANARTNEPTIKSKFDD